MINSGTAALLSAVAAGVVTYLTTHRTAGVTEKVGTKTAQVTEQTANERLLLDTLKDNRADSVAIVKDLRDDVRALKEDLRQTNVLVAELRADVTRLNKENDGMRGDHARKERAWDAAKFSLEEKIADQGATIDDLRKANGDLRQSNQSLVDFIAVQEWTFQQSAVLMIGDIEITKKKDAQQVDRLDAAIERAAQVALNTPLESAPGSEEGLTN